LKRNSFGQCQLSITISQTKSETSSHQIMSTFTTTEVAKHNSKEDCWVIIANKVYDVTTFLSDHPGGQRAILMYAGKDATKEFQMLHTKNILNKYATNLYRGEISNTHQTTSAVARNQTAARPLLTVQEVAKHSSKEDCWVIIENNVYDVTTFLSDHPGGKRAILMYAGKDGTKEFKMLHNKNILKKYGKNLLLGPLVGTSNGSEIIQVSLL